MRRGLVSVLVLVLAVIPVTRSEAVGEQEATFIVVLKPGTDDVAATAEDLTRDVNAELETVYDAALDGFSVTATAREAADLARDPLVAYVERDEPVSSNDQEVPTGIDRIFASGNVGLDVDGVDDVRVDVDVAVLDGGIDLQHPDLDVVGGVDCMLGPSCVAGGDDDGRHGTHVAGTIGALDNGFGVVGVAPGARLWAVKVLDANGNGFVSGIIRGVDWVTANAGTIEVVNMSLGAAGFSQALHDAIQSAVDQGVAFAVSAGNFDVNAANYSPAAFDNVLTVSALADFDGRPGGRGSPTCQFDQDDTLADFSNWGAVVDIVAPGRCITSTWPVELGGYGVMSGTSMAAPHVAGALALLASKSNPANAIDVAGLYSRVLAAGNSEWTDDSGDGVKEPLLDVSVPALFAAWVPPCASVDPAGLIGRWSLDQTLSSIVGPVLTGSTTYTPAVVGFGARSGSNTSLATTTLPTVSTGVSVEMWVKPTASATVQVLASRWNFPGSDDTSRVFALLFDPSGYLVFQTDEPSARRPDELRVDATQLIDGGFHHVAATRDETDTRIYIDGVVVAVAPTRNGLLNAAPSVPFQVGSKGGLGDPFRFNGVIDEPSVWDRALEPAEIAALVAAGPTGACPPAP
jgi:subtilisin family serine protease